MTNNGPICAVVFDLDGLMFNTEELYEYVGGEVLRRRGRQFTGELLDAMMGRPSRVALRIMIDWHELDDTVEQIDEESRDIFAGILNERLAPMPGLLDLLAGLERAELPKAIATSSSRSFATDVLGRFDLERRFEFLLTGDDVDQGKPHPEIYQRAAAQLNCDPRQVLVLEDSANGCRSAVAAGTFAVAAPAGRSQKHDFSGAAMVIDTLADPRLYEVLGIDGRGD